MSALAGNLVMDVWLMKAIAAPPVQNYHVAIVADAAS